MRVARRALVNARRERRITCARAGIPDTCAGFRARSPTARRVQCLPGTHPWESTRVRSRLSRTRILAAGVPVLDDRARGGSRVGGVAARRPDRVLLRTGVAVPVAARATLADRHAGDPGAHVAHAGLDDGLGE